MGVGTSFTFFLPAIEKGEIQRSLIQNLSFKGNGKILILEDETSVANTLKIMLKRFSLDSIITYEGKDTITKYIESITNNKPFQAVILDLTVPGGMGGVETMKELIKIDPNVLAIVSSGYSTGEVMSNFEKFGFKGILMKPYTLSELGGALKKLIGGDNNPNPSSKTISTIQIN